MAAYELVYFRNTILRELKDYLQSSVLYEKKYSSKEIVLQWFDQCLITFTEKEI